MTPSIYVMREAAFINLPSDGTSSHSICQRHWLSCPHILNCSLFLRSLAVSPEKRRWMCVCWTSLTMRSPSATTRSRRWGERRHWPQDEEWMNTCSHGTDTVEGSGKKGEQEGGGEKSTTEMWGEGNRIGCYLFSTSTSSCLTTSWPSASSGRWKEGKHMFMCGGGDGH